MTSPSPISPSSDSSPLTPASSAPGLAPASSAPGPAPASSAPGPPPAFSAPGPPPASSASGPSSAPAASACVLRLDGITLRRGGNGILNGISWTIRPGENWALLGANGSGKTTLLKVVTGYEWPTEGTVEVLGQRFGQCNLPELRKRIGWVSSALFHRLPEQNTAVQIVLSGLEATMGLYREFTAEETARARGILSLLGGGAYAERTYGLLSQGEQQRVLIARGLVHEPALLILDEPCAGLDPVAREGFLADLARLSRRPGAPALVLVTHHIEEIAPWITHALVLRAGEPVAQGRTVEILTGEILGRALDHPCEVVRSNGRFSLALHIREESSPPR